ncbi:MAG TPA: hypothetical protein VFE51_24730 [Verrucomicrobiae bacterium]|nr:hypothetical protein [Verrucomicrobiae bacterium]
MSYSELQSRLARVQWLCLLVGLVALAVTFIGAFVNRTQFFFSYLYGYLFWLGLSLGCFVVTMIHQLAGGRWGYPTRRFLEAGFLVLPLMLLLLIPIFFGLSDLYPWARPAEVAAEKVLRERHAYQNGWGYTVRSVAFMLLWIWMAWCLRKWSLQQDQTDDAAPTRKARALSAPGLVVYCLLGTVIYIDWVMSLETRWYSTIFAVIIIIGQILVAYAFSVILLALFARHEPFAAILSKTHFHHLGNLLLAFVMFWTYVSFGQLLIVYSGDLPPELKWYLHRIAGNWRWVVGALALFHFFLPFYLLLFRTMKRRIAPLAILASLLFVMHIVQTYWLVMPALHHDQVSLSWMDFSTPIGIGGLWLAFFLSRLRAAPLILLKDPGLQFAFRYGH